MKTKIVSLSSLKVAETHLVHLHTLKLQWTMCKMRKVILNQVNIMN